MREKSDFDERAKSRRGREEYPGVKAYASVIKQSNNIKLLLGGKATRLMMTMCCFQYVWARQCCCGKYLDKIMPYPQSPSP